MYRSELPKDSSLRYEILERVDGYKYTGYLVMIPRRCYHNYSVSRINTYHMIIANRPWLCLPGLHYKKFT